MLDSVDKKDILRTMYLASSLMLIFATFYAVYLHSGYSGKINEIRIQLSQINQWYEGKAEKTTGNKTLEYREIARTAQNLSDMISGPKLTPYAYEYLNYWIESSAFTNVLLSYSDLGLDNKTIYALQKLDSMGWFDNSSFYIFDLNRGEFVQELASKPVVNAHPWSYYLFILIFSGAGVWLGIKKKYENGFVVPSIICAALSLIPFWIVVIFGVIIGMLFGVIRSETVSFGAYVVSLIVTIVLSALSGAIVGIIRERREKE